MAEWTNAAVSPQRDPFGKNRHGFTNGKYKQKNTFCFLYTFLGARKPETIIMVTQKISKKD